MNMRLKQTSLAIIVGASLLSACTPNLHQVMPGQQAQASPPPPVAKPKPKPAPRPAPPPVAKPKKPAPVSRTLPLPKEESPKVEVLQHRQEEAISDEEQEPEVLEVKKDESRKKYDSSPAARALVKQADTEIGMGKLAAATATVERALRIEPENPDLWMKLSELHKRQGNDEQATSMADKAAYYQEQLN